MPPSVSSQAARPEEALHLSAPEGMALGADLAISGRSLRRSSSAGRVARQAALLQEQAPSRCLPSLFLAGSQCRRMSALD